MRVHAVVPISKMPTVTATWLREQLLRLQQRTLTPEGFVDALDEEGIIRDIDRGVILQFARQVCAVAKQVDQHVGEMRRWLNITS